MDRTDETVSSSIEWNINWRLEGGHTLGLMVSRVREEAIESDEEEEGEGEFREVKKRIAD